ncbi:MAG: hypothetical protein AAF125_24050, partial [Chloroflexota bacterium]
ALAKAPEDRYKTPSALINALDEALTSPQSSDDALATAELPPLPPGMVAPNRTMSSQSIAERIALGIDERTTPAPPKPRTRAAEANQDLQSSSVPSALRGETISLTGKANGRRWLFALIPILVLVMGIPLLVLLRGESNESVLPTIAPTVQAVLPSETPGVVAVTIEETSIPTTIVPTASMIPSTPTALPPTAKSPPPTMTTVPPTLAQVDPAIVTEVPQPTAPPQPTILYPNGNRITLLWNDSSFYWHNPTGASIRVSPIRFEAIDAAGTFTGNAFDGLRWTIGFNAVEGGRCVAVELLQTTDWLRPDECIRGYNSQLTLQQGNNEVFWTGDNVTQFRVLWENEEIARCLITDRNCNVFLP